MLKSTKQIFDTAQDCFLHHGYSATSIAMISRYSKVSRVTIHKQFSSKEVLFRAFIENFLKEKDILIQTYVSSTGTFWQDTYDFLAKRCSEVFDNIPNSIIKADLVHAGQSYCADLLEKNRIKTREAMETKLRYAIENDQISLEKINLTIQDFAFNIEALAEGILVSSNSTDPLNVLKQTLTVYKIASQKET